MEEQTFLVSSEELFRFFVFLHMPVVTHLVLISSTSVTSYYLGEKLFSKQTKTAKE